MNLAPLALVVLVSGSVLAENGSPARVYVYTPLAEGMTEEEVRGLLDSARDVTEALGRRKSDFLVVSAADEAEVIVEVASREERDVSPGGFGGATVTRFRETIVRLKVKCGEKQSELKGIGRPSWKSAAKDVVERLAKWVRSQRTRETAGLQPAVPVLR